MKSDSLKSNFKFIISNGVGVFFIRVFASGLGFLFQIMLGRILGIDNYGMYTIFVTYINFMCLFTVLGLDNSLIRAVARIKVDYKKDLLKKTILNSIIYFVIFLMLSILCKNLIKQLVGVIDIKFYLLLYITLFVKTMASIMDGYYQGEKRIVIDIVISSLLLNLLKIVLFILIYMVYNDVYSAIISYLFSEFLCLIFRIYIYIKEKKSDEKNNVKYKEYSLEKYKEFLRYSFSLSLIAGTSILVQSIDKLMLNSMMGKYSVGLYRTAENYVNLISMFASTFIVFWPVMSELYYEKKIKLLNEIFGYICKILSFMSIPVILVVIIYSKELFLLFGKEYVNGNSILVVLLIGIIVDTLAGPVGALLNMTNYAKYNLIDMVGLTILNIILNFILIPRFGVIGAAIATSLSNIIINFINIIQNKILLDVFPYDKKLICFILSAIPILILDKYLYNNIFIERNLITMSITIIINYIVYLILFLIIIKPNFKEIKKILKDRS